MTFNVKVISMSLTLCSLSQICCTIKNDLLSTLEQLVAHKDKFDYVMIETTGLANPGPIISTFWTDAELDSPLYLDGVVCVVDALHIVQYLVDEEISEGVRLQICYADRILLNKTDLVPGDKVRVMSPSNNNALLLLLRALFRLN